MTSRFSVLCMAIVALSLSACSQRVENPQVVVSPDKVSLMLAEAADKASRSLETLAAVEQARSPGVAVQPIHNAPTELARTISVEWIGPASQITQKLANRASYQFLSYGNQPPVPLLVNINVENRPVIEVLRDIGLQLGVRADVKVDAQRRVVELHYAPVTGIGG